MVMKLQYRKSWISIDGYISKLSLRKLYDEYGNVYMVVDSELKGRIQAAVMDMIANFEIVVI